MPFGLLGYLAGEMANEAAARAALVRYTDTLEKKLGSYNHKAVLDETFERSFVLEAATVNPKEIDKLEIVDYPEIRTGDGRAIKNYAVLGEKLGVDSVLAVDFSYGLEVWEKTLAAVVITSDVTAIRITDNVVLMNAHISSGTIEKALHTVDELMSNNARLYKIEYAKACKAIVYLIAAHLGVNLSSTGTFSWQPEDTEVTGTEGPRK
jgi:hypothetical protein